MFSAKDFSVLHAVSFSYYNPRTEQPKRVRTFPLFLTFLCVNYFEKEILSRRFEMQFGPQRHAMVRI